MLPKWCERSQSLKDSRFQEQGFPEQQRTSTTFRITAVGTSIKTFIIVARRQLRIFEWLGYNFKVNNPGKMFLQLCRRPHIFSRRCLSKLGSEAGRLRIFITDIFWAASSLTEQWRKLLFFKITRNVALVNVCGPTQASRIGESLYSFCMQHATMPWQLYMVPV